MSVAICDDSELRGLLEALVFNGVPRDEAGITLTALGLANRAASLLTYGDETALAKPDLEAGESSPIPCPEWSLADWIGSLLYNCVTNAGTDFAPPNYAEKAKEWARQFRQVRPALVGR